MPLPEQDHQSNAKSGFVDYENITLLQQNVDLHLSGWCIGNFWGYANANFVMWLHQVLLLDHYYFFQLLQVITNFPLSGEVAVMHFSTYYGYHGYCWCWYWQLMMLIVAKSASNYVNSFIVHEFGCAIFQTVDVVMHGKLSVVKLEVENRLAVYNLQDNYIPDG